MEVYMLIGSRNYPKSSTILAAMLLELWEVTIRLAVS